jgi:hypothetical protein
MLEIAAFVATIHRASLYGYQHFKDQSIMTTGMAVFSNRQTAKRSAPSHWRLEEKDLATLVKIGKKGPLADNLAGNIWMRDGDLPAQQR